MTGGEDRDSQAGACSKCGRTLPPDAPEGLCPACLAALGACAETGSSAEASTIEEPASTVIEGVGSVIGRYRLLEQIGEGGFGVVYLAEQREPINRKVALKIIKLGMDTRQVIARFEAERQALALMDHPNIARVLDAGATQLGRPYFVMEWVRGVPITTFCDERRLPMRDRLQLFADVCTAVQHAHQKGIIHRDLKPSNVLVKMQEDKPLAKVIDFGIAKATAQKLTDLTLVTGMHQFLGTPAYMSPEQTVLGGMDIDTRSDVYSLGVMLYELLAGQPPFGAQILRQGGHDEMRRIIREEDPPRPSTRIEAADGIALDALGRNFNTEGGKLGRIVRGDLDWIVMKAIAKERTRRYDTAEALARDISRYLAGEAVEAAPPSTIYRFKKFTRRNRTLVLSSAAAGVALLLGAAVSVWFAVQAGTAERTSAEARGQAETLIQETNETLVADLESVGKLNLLQGVAEMALAYFERMPQKLRSGATERLRASAHENLGAVRLDQGRGPESESLIAAGLAIRRAILETEGASRADTRELAEALIAHSKVLRELDREEEASKEAEEARDKLLGLGSPDALETRELELLARSYQELVRIYPHTGRRKPGADGSSKARAASILDAFERVARLIGERDDASVKGRIFQAEALIEQGEVADEEGDIDAQRHRYGEAVEVLEKMREERSRDAVILGRLAVAYDCLGDALRAEATDAGRKEALEVYRRYLAVTGDLVSLDPTNAGWKHERATAQTQIARLLTKLGDHPAAEDAYDEAVGLRRELALINREDQASQWYLASVLFEKGGFDTGLTSVLEAEDERRFVLDRAGGLLSEAQSMAHRYALDSAAEARWRKLYLSAIRTRGEVLSLLGKHRQGAELLRFGKEQATEIENSFGEPLGDSQSPEMFAAMEKTVRERIEENLQPESGESVKDEPAGSGTNPDLKE